MNAEVNTVATSIDAFYLSSTAVGDLDGGFEDDRVSCGRLDSARYAY